MSVYFEDMVFETKSDVYTPAEDSFVLAKNQGVKPGDVVLDVGTGCGIQSIVASKVAEKVVGVDVNDKAIELARYNANLNKVFNVEFLVSDLFDNVEGKFDLILFNTPYLPVSENDRLGKAWSGGDGGVQVLVEFIKQAADYLKPWGKIRVLTSSVNPQLMVEKLFEDNGFAYELEKTQNLFFEQLHIYCLWREEDSSAPAVELLDECEGGQGV